MKAEERSGAKRLTLFAIFVLTLAAWFSGWGLDDVPEFFRNPARAALVAVECAALIAALALGIELVPFRKGREEGRHWPIIAGMLVVPLIFGVVASFDRRSVFVFRDAGWLRWTGVVAYSAGLALRLTALRQLGKQYSVFLTLQSEHELIQSGVYRLIRHPIYLAQMLMIPGVLLSFRSPLATFVLAVTVLFVANRIYREEELLTGEFGEGYREYRRGSWKMVPWVW